MASSSSAPHVALEVGEDHPYPYPYPSHVCAPNFVTFNQLSGRDEYHMWKTQMLCLLESHGMLGFVDGTFLSPQTTVSGKEKVGDLQTHRSLWRRSDALVKGWILGSLSKQTLGCVLNRLTRKHPDFTAKHVWDQVESLYGQVVPPQPPAVVPSPDLPSQPQTRNTDSTQQLEEKEIQQQQQGINKDLEEGRRAKQDAKINKDLEADRRWLHRAILEEDLFEIDDIMLEQKIRVTESITSNGSTALHVAVSRSKKAEILQKLLEHLPEDTQLSTVTNSDGSTPLHVAVIVGNTKAVDILVAKDRNLLLAEDKKGHTPLFVALSNMHTETIRRLLQLIDTGMEGDALFSGTSGDDLLVTAISSKDFRLALDLMDRYKILNSDAVLMAIAQNFPCAPGVFGEFRKGARTLNRGIRRIFDDERRNVKRKIIWIIFLVTYVIICVFPGILAMIAWPFTRKRVQKYNDALRLLIRACSIILFLDDTRSHQHYYMNPILEAARQDAHYVVEVIVGLFPNAIWTTNEDGHDIVQCAVINRSKNVYNLLYQMSEHKNVYRTITDSSGNNLLHLAARLAPTNKLNVISGAALQIQHELQWFEEVKRFVCPLSIAQKNSFDETPLMVFTREHKDLVIEGEKWMKATAESYTITAALITTIMFAAAITVPGGNNQDTGLPVFTNKPSFKIFAIADAISLFASVMSLLVFLSILTARFAQEDFLFKLPTKLVVGLVTLFISTTAMIVAFGATLYLVFGESNSHFLILIVVSTSLPIACFVALQLHLVVDLMSATCDCSMFGKKGYELFY